MIYHWYSDFSTLSFSETATKWGCPSDETKKPGVRVTTDVKR